jgi:hypothetical protein
MTHFQKAAKRLLRRCVPSRRKLRRQLREEAAKGGCRQKAAADREEK